MSPKNFAITGVAGYIAPRHLKAIQDTGNRLVAATDPHDAVGVLDRFAFDVRFFTEIERFDRHLEKLRRGPEEQRVHYVSVCSPNYLHDAHMRLALRVGADAICEKPLVINPWNLDGLQELERETGGRVSTVLQLRLHPQLIALRDRLHADPVEAAPGVARPTSPPAAAGTRCRGRATRIDRAASSPTSASTSSTCCCGCSGRCAPREVHLREPARAAGALDLERADVRWFLSTDAADLPFAGEARHEDDVPIDRRWTARRSSSATASPISTPASTKRCWPAAASASTTRGRRSS